MGTGRTVAHKLIAAHLLDGRMQPGAPGQGIGIRIDQTLTQDATGTLVMLELEAMQLDRVKTELSVQYVDHNVVQEDFKYADDHLFLHSACQRFGVWDSPARLVEPAAPSLLKWHVHVPARICERVGAVSPARPLATGHGYQLC